MPAIVLAGFMCSGKTTLGEALARRLSVSFTDLDAAIENRLGMSVREIFLHKGKDAFRQIEVKTLDIVLAQNPDGVIALGGGTPCRPGIMERLNETSRTVWLEASPERLIPRLMNGRQNRPLLQAISTEDEMRGLMNRLLADRNPYYSKARHHFDSSFLETSEEVNSSVDKFISEILLSPKS